jgi:integrase
MARPPLPIHTHGEIKAKQLGKGKWEARTRYRDFDGTTRQMRRTGRTETAAKNAVKEAVRDNLGASGDGEITADSRVRELADIWWDEYKASKTVPAGTIHRYKGVIERHIKDGLGDRRLRECTVSSIDKFLKAKTRNVGYSTSSIAAVLLRGMFDLAARHDAIESNPVVSAASVPKPKNSTTAFSIKDVAELRKILRAWDAGNDRSGRKRVSDLADPVDMFLATGARPGEIFAIKWELIDLSLTPARVRLTSTMAKDENGHWRIQPHRKNRKDISVPLPKFASQMLLRRRVNSIGELVFPSSALTPRIPDNFRTQWHAALEGTPYAGRLPSEFRSTVATLLRDAAGIEAAQHQLNHASLLTTEQHYAVPLTVVPDHTDVLEQFDVLAD